MQNRARAPSIVVAGKATITLASPLFRHSLAKALKQTSRDQLGIQDRAERSADPSAL